MFYPLLVNLEGRAVVVIGGGRVALRKVQSLLACGAVVTVISPELVTELDLLARQATITLRRRCYQQGDLAGAWLVIVACGDTMVNKQVRAEADELGIFCNVVDDPRHCSFQVPAVVRRGALTVTVSTDGISPALAKYLRQELEQQFGPEYANLLDALAQLREHVQGVYAGQQGRRREILEGFVQVALKALRDEPQTDFTALLEQWKRR